MVSIQETAYPRLKSNYSKKELDDIYTPTPSELAWMIQSAKGSVSKVGFLVSLKVFQRLGYFVSVTDVSSCIVEHIARLVSIPSPPLEELKAYNQSGTYDRHHSLIRKYLNVRIYNSTAKQIMFETMTEAALTKDDSADLINVAIERLIREHHELPAFSTLAKAADHVYAKAYRDLYERINNLLSTDEKDTIDSLLRTSTQSTYTPWHQLKQDPSSSTLTHLKELVTHHEWLSAQQVGAQALQEIPVAKWRLRQKP